ncbi:MAG: cytochrome c oxidase subunit [Gemmatimonadaceae bacterium]|jgi:cytochrome c oxidase subunit 2|nr:cytochrome c oxidase subunit [Gemmatimonadaceae bacterium]
MKGTDRLRRLASYAFLAAFAIAAISCNEAHPNTTLVPHSDFGREIDFLWDRLLLLGTIVFVLVEAALIFVVIKYRRRENQPPPPQTHGSTKLEITWTLIPAIILVFIAVPTVRTIFITQAQAAPGSLNIDVTGHQWWWEFRYPEYGVTTANELYLPVGRTVNFRLRSADVIHSFWTPQLGGKRDVVTNRTNYIWYTPDSSTASSVWNGFCVEYCGSSHANMRFRVFTVTPEQFASWVAGQKMPARFGAVAPAPPAGGPIPPPQEGAVVTSPGGSNSPTQAAQAAAPRVAQQSSGTQAAGGTQPAIPRPQNPGANPGAQAGVRGVAPAGASFASTSGGLAPGYIFPREKIPDYAVPHAPIPPGLKFTAGLTGSAARGKQVFSSSACIGCHSIAGNPAAMGITGPNLTHVGSRSTLAAGRFPNAAAYMALWIKNARAMKPEVIMPTLGLDEYDPVLKTKVTAATGGLTDQQIADIVAYLTALK